MQVICKICKICIFDFHMQNMQEYALPTLLIPSTSCSPDCTTSFSPSLPEQPTLFPLQTGIFEPSLQKWFMDNLETRIVSSKTIAYLKWLIYIAAFKDEKHRSLLEDSQFYLAQCKTLEAAESNFWKEDLLDELETWYQVHPPTSKKRKSFLQNEFTNVEIDVFPRRVRAPGGWMHWQRLRLSLWQAGQLQRRMIWN